MQEKNLNCERDEYPPYAFWQDQDIHEQWIRMLPKTQNGAVGNIFGLGVCRYDHAGKPPTSSRNLGFDRLGHGPGRVTSIFTVDVTTTLAAVSIGFSAIPFPNEAEFGLTANPCWPSTLVDDPGFALLTSDRWYFNEGANRANNLPGYANPPPQALVVNNPPRQSYQKRSVGPVDLDSAPVIKLRNCRSTDCVQELGDMRNSLLDNAPPELQSLPRPSEAEPTVVDTDLVPAVTSTAAVVGGGGAQLALNLMPKPTGGTE